MSITVRKCYLVLDQPSKALLPEMCKVAQGDINRLIGVEHTTRATLRDKRLSDPATCVAQQEIDALSAQEQAEWVRIRAPGEQELEQLRAATYNNRHDPEKHHSAHQTYKTRRDEIKSERHKAMKSFKDNINFDERWDAAQSVVRPANRRDHDAMLKVALPQEIKNTSHQYNKYHMYDYTQQGLRRARETSRSGEVEFRTFVRGYGTDLPTNAVLPTGHSQTESARRLTLMQLRDGASNRVLKRLQFPTQEAWNPALPKSERKRLQRGQVEFILMGHKMRGSVWFHQQAPDQFCVTDCKVSVEVRSGNVHTHLLLTLMDKSASDAKQHANSFTTLQDGFKTLSDLATAGLDELKGAKKLVGNLKGKTVKRSKALAKAKKLDQSAIDHSTELLAAIEAKTQEINSLISFKIMEAKQARALKKVSK